jgi:hypothetical protein
VATVMAVLVGGLILLLKNATPTRTDAPHRPNNGSVIMEGVDINSNGPQHHLRPDLPSERTHRISGAIWIPVDAVHPTPER